MCGVEYAGYDSQSCDERRKGDGMCGFEEGEGDAVTRGERHVRGVFTAEVAGPRDWDRCVGGEGGDCDVAAVPFAK